MNSLHNTLLAGAEHHRQGRIAEAERHYRLVLQAQPNQADALHLLGVIAGQAGRPLEAIDLIQRAIAVNPNVADFHNNLGMVYITQKDWPRAEAALQRGLTLNPQSAVALNGMGDVLREQGRFREAYGYFDRTLAVQPNYPEALNKLVNILIESGQATDVIAWCQQVLAANPRSAESHFSLGRAYKELGQPDRAVAHYEAALQIQPTNVDAYLNLGNIHLERRELALAGSCYQQAVQHKPDSAKGYNNLGTVAREMGKSLDAIRLFEKAIALDPNYATAHNNLGAALNDQGRIEEALVEYRRAVRLAPNDRLAHSNLLMGLLYSPTGTLAELYDESLAWSAQHAASIVPLPEGGRDGNSQRRLKIGYLGADLRRHPVGYFLEPVLAHHDKRAFEVVCYASQAANDDWSEKLRAHADLWRNVIGLRDDDLARQIQADGIDILVDLSGHAGMSRLLVFARRPAQIQVTGLGYMATTGMKCMDYYIADRHIVPPDERRYYSEKVLCLPDSYYCMSPLDFAPPVNELPALKNGYVTFGCFNNLSKIHGEVIRVWARILEQTPQSRLFLKTKSLNDSAVRERITDLFLQQSVAPDRLRLEGHSPRQELLASYNEVDLGLDPFPYTGGVTTFESLWMGVPVVSLSRPGIVGHNGASTLASLKLVDWIAKTVEEYIHKNVQFAKDAGALRKSRSELRNLVRQSPLCDGHKYTRALESHYRQIWVDRHRPSESSVNR